MVPWFLTVLPYALMVCHVRKTQSIANHAQQIPQIQVINGSGQHMEVREAWVEDLSDEGQQGNESDKVKVLSISLTSMAALGALGATKIIIPGLFVYRIFTDHNRTMETTKVELGLSIKVGEDVFNVLFALFNCRNLIGLAVTDLYLRLQESLKLSEAESSPETSSRTLGRLAGVLALSIPHDQPINTNHI